MNDPPKKKPNSSRSSASPADHSASHADHVVAESNYLRLVKQQGWDFVQRKGSSGVVTVLAVTPDHRVILVEQYRIPVCAHVIEFPAGLAGDIVGASDESLADAARRELLEETGYESEQLTRVLTGPSSAGLTDEMITFFVAAGLRRVGPGGGDESESIEVHLVPLAEIDDWLKAKTQSGALVDARLYTGIYLLNQFVAQQAAQIATGSVNRSNHS